VSFARVRGPRLLHRLLARTAEPLLPAQVAAVFEHVAGVRVQRPVAALARSLGGPRHLDETVVERQAVPDGVLPALLVLPVVRKQVHDELVDLAERAHAARRVLDGERDERDVGVGRLGVSVVAPAVGPVDHGRSGFAAAASRRRRFRRRDAVGDVEGRDPAVAAAGGRQGVPRQWSYRQRGAVSATGGRPERRRLSRLRRPTAGRSQGRRRPAVPCAGTGAAV